MFFKYYGEICLDMRARHTHMHANNTLDCAHSVVRMSRNTAEAEGISESICSLLRGLVDGEASWPSASVFGIRRVT